MIQHLNHRPKSIPPRHVPRDLPVLECAHGNPEFLGGIGLGEPLALAPILHRLAELFSRHGPLIREWRRRGERVDSGAAVK